MYPRNAASPPRIYVGPVVQISDGAVQTSGVAVTVTPEGGTETASGGTVAYSTKGGVWYTPTQAETNYTAFVVEASKTGCIPAGVTIVTTAGATAGIAVCADTQKVDVNTIKTQAVTCAAGVTVLAQVGAAGAPGANNGLVTTNGTVVNQTVGLTAGQSIACSDKTGFSLSATGADLILKSSTFVQAIVAAVNEFATYGLTALNTLLVTTGIKAVTVPAVTLANGAHGGAAATLTLSGAAGLVATKIDAPVNGAITGNITGNLSGSVGSVTGAVGSVTGAVGSVTGAVGSVTGAVGSVTGAVGSVAANGITATSIASDAINAAAVKADAVTKIQNGLATPTNITAGTITTVTNLTNAPTNGDLTAAMKASINAEVDTALNTAIPGAPTADSINERIVALDTGVVVATGGIAALSFAAGAIDAAALAANAIGSSELADGAITAAKVADAAIDQATFAADVYVVANVKKINDTTLTGNGSTTPWGPQ